MKGKTTIEIEIDEHDKSKCSFKCTGYTSYYCEVFCIEIYDMERCKACKDGEVKNA